MVPICYILFMLNLVNLIVPFGVIFAMFICIWLVSRENGPLFYEMWPACYLNIFMRAEAMFSMPCGAAIVMWFSCLWHSRYIVLLNYSIQISFPPDKVSARCVGLGIVSMISNDLYCGFAICLSMECEFLIVTLSNSANSNRSILFWQWIWKYFFGVFYKKKMYCF